MRAVITGGGTGGHIYPALAVGLSLKKKGWDILYLGSTNGLEKEIVPEKGIEFKTVDVAPLPRKVNLQLLNSLYLTSRGLLQARKIIKEFNPDVVLGTGGFVAGPVVLAASLAGFNTIIHEQNVYPGITNRLLAHRVDRVAINFADAAQYLSKNIKEKIVVTGNPIREIIMQTDRSQGIEKLQLDPGKKTLLVFGGSRGAASINQAMVDVLLEFKDKKWLQIIHSTGKKNYDAMIEQLKQSGVEIDRYKHLKVLPYLNNMEWALAAADLIISRAGATGLAEITALGLPAILIPYPHAAANHQEYNARSLEKKGAARVITDQQVSGDILLKEIKEIFSDESKLLVMKKNSLKIGQPSAREKLVAEIEQLVQKKKKSNS